jgi:hypothetical protein
LQVNPRSAPNRLPPEAKWYVSKIYYGSTYDEVVFGQATTFTPSVGANFLSWGGSLSGFVAQNHLQTTMVIRGMRPNNGAAIFSQNVAEAARNFTTEGGEVPILVEYKTVPNIPPPPRRHIDWRY